MYTIKVEVRWRAAHRLMDYVGKCQNLHGEAYTATFWFAGPTLDKSGILMDFGPTKREINKWVDTYLDHASMLRKDDPLVDVLQALNQRVYIMETNPTAENIAELLFNQFKDLTSVILTQVRVRESFEDSEAYFSY